MNNMTSWIPYLQSKSIMTNLPMRMLQGPYKHINLFFHEMINLFCKMHTKCTIETVILILFLDGQPSCINGNYFVIAKPPILSKLYK